MFGRVRATLTDSVVSGRPFRGRLAPSPGDDQVSERWVSVQDIADHLGVTRDTVYKWIEARALPAHRLGRLWKFKISQVDDWVEAGGAAEPDDRDRREGV